MTTSKFQKFKILVTDIITENKTKPEINSSGRGKSGNGKCGKWDYSGEEDQRKLPNGHEDKGYTRIPALL
jgi:hypothetical protein